jgi:hypothetical protein
LENTSPRSRQCRRTRSAGSTTETATQSGYDFGYEYRVEAYPLVSGRVRSN